MNCKRHKKLKILLLDLATKIESLQNSAKKYVNLLIKYHVLKKDEEENREEA